MLRLRPSADYFGRGRTIPATPTPARIRPIAPTPAKGARAQIDLVSLASHDFLLWSVDSRADLLVKVDDRPSDTQALDELPLGLSRPDSEEMGRNLAIDNRRPRRSQ